MPDEFSLLPHQQRVVDRIQAPDQKGLVVMHGVGAGKSLSSIAAIKALGNESEIMVPAALQDNYKKEIKKWTGGSPSDMGARISSQQNLAVKGVDQKSLEGKTLVVDESHRLRNSSSKLYQELKHNQAVKRLLLTATPIYNHPSDIAPLINLASGKQLMPERKPDFENEFIAKKLIHPSFVHKMMGLNPGVQESLKNVPKLRAILNKYVDYHPGSTEGFPEVNEEEIKVKMAPQQERLYNTILNKVPWYIRAKVRAGLAPGKNELEKMLPFLTGVRQVANTDAGFLADPSKGVSPKTDKAFQYLKERMSRDPNFKAVVYSNFLDNGLARYKQQLDESKIPYGEYTGEVGKEQRDQLIRDYNENKLKTLLISSAGGEGLDLKGTRLVQLMEPHLNESKEKQIIGRAARYLSHDHLPQRDRNVLVQRYLADTNPGMFSRAFNRKEVGIDEYIRNMAKDKSRLSDQFIDLIRGQGQR